jgi:hypothetical protein
LISGRDAKLSAPCTRPLVSISARPRRSTITTRALVRWPYAEAMAASASSCFCVGA